MDMEHARQFLERRCMPAKMDRYVMREAGMKQPVEACRHVTSLHLDQQAITGDLTSRRNRLPFKGHPMILAVTAPDARYGDLRTYLQLSVHDEGTRSIEVLA